MTFSLVCVFLSDEVRETSLSQFSLFAQHSIWESASRAIRSFRDMIECNRSFFCSIEHCVSRLASGIEMRSFRMCNAISVVAWCFRPAQRRIAFSAQRWELHLSPDEHALIQVAFLDVFLDISDAVFSASDLNPLNTTGVNSRCCLSCTYARRRVCA